MFSDFLTTPSPTSKMKNFPLTNTAVPEFARSALAGEPVPIV
jgi:hypothetical protein